MIDFNNLKKQENSQKVIATIYTHYYSSLNIVLKKIFKNKKI